VLRSDVAWCAVNAIYWPSAEALVTAVRLGSDGEMASPEALREQLLGVLQRMVSRCRQAGIADKEIAEARYAVVAFMDERILRSNWAGRVEWMNRPLQLQLYNEFAAGENFFVRMRTLLAEGGESRALEIYSLCLALGFVGAAGAAQQAQSVTEEARRRLVRAAAGASISPHAVPADHYSATTPRRPFVLAVALSCVLVVALGVGLLRWSLDNRLARTTRDLTAARAAQAPAKGK
jgi:type VI secretion system protein ImpK